MHPRPSADTVGPFAPSLRVSTRRSSPGVRLVRRGTLLAVRGLVVGAGLRSLGVLGLRALCGFGLRTLGPLGPLVARGDVGELVLRLRSRNLVVAHLRLPVALRLLDRLLELVRALLHRTLRGLHLLDPLLVIHLASVGHRSALRS